MTSCAVQEVTLGTSFIHYGWFICSTAPVYHVYIFIMYVCTIIISSVYQLGVSMSLEL